LNPDLLSALVNDPDAHVRAAAEYVQLHNQPTLRRGERRSLEDKSAGKAAR
jgi:hypothetical protein